MLCLIMGENHKTSDGSDTIFNEDLNETYHSLNGSIKESELVYKKRIRDILDKKTKFY